MADEGGLPEEERAIVREIARAMFQINAHENGDYDGPEAIKNAWHDQKMEWFGRARRLYNKMRGSGLEITSAG